MKTSFIAYIKDQENRVSKFGGNLKPFQVNSEFIQEVKRVNRFSLIVIINEDIDKTVKGDKKPVLKLVA